MRLDVLNSLGRTALHLGVYLPIGAALAARDLLLSRDRLAELYDELVDRGRERLGAVTGGPRERLERISLDRAGLDGEEAAVETEPSTATGRIPAPVADELPIDRYDNLTAQQIAARLRGLTRDELDRIRAYERDHRGRATVLRAVEPLMGELPIHGYDQLTAEEIVRRLPELSNAELEVVRDYEARTGSRATVLERIDSLKA
jgi:hypothetical protein